MELAGGGLEQVLEAAKGYDAVLFDSLTLWVSARMLRGEDSGTLNELDGLLEGAAPPGAPPMLVVSDEVGLGGVAASAPGRAFADLLGLANQRVAAAAGEVHLCVAGVPVRVK